MQKKIQILTFSGFITKKRINSIVLKLYPSITLVNKTVSDFLLFTNEESK